MQRGPCGRYSVKSIFTKRLNRRRSIMARRRWHSISHPLGSVSLTATAPAFTHQRHPTFNHIRAAIGMGPTLRLRHVKRGGDRQLDPKKLSPACRWDIAYEIILMRQLGVEASLFGSSARLRLGPESRAEVRDSSRPGCQRCLPAPCLHLSCTAASGTYFDGT